MGDGRFDVDFGDCVSGWVRLNDFCIPDGQEISIEFPSESDGNGEYRYVGNGKKVKSYAPRFCWWVFSKAVVSGWPGELRPSDICADKQAKLHLAPDAERQYASGRGYGLPASRKGALHRGRTGGLCGSNA